MRVAEVIGTVTLNRCHPSFQGARLKIAVPLSLENLTEETQPDPVGMVVCWDEFGAGIGSHIAMAEGPEASQPFRPDVKPVDAYNAAILDEVNIS